ncbi:MAG TPA: hypothetical protein VND20_10240 [Candidatus Binataceae bacterium]|nr:hypothetical protein [Candidatus Binataceae bacterium]
MTGLNSPSHFIATPSSISPTYTPEAPVDSVKGAGAVSVAVEDLRAAPGKVGNDTGLAIKAGNGVISTTVPVKDLVRTAIESELRNRGFTIAGGGAGIAIAITEFDVQHSQSATLMAVQSYSYAAVMIHATVTGAGHKRLYSQPISAQSASADGNDQATLDRALAMAMHNLFADPLFIKAILTAERGPKS